MEDAELIEQLKDRRKELLDLANDVEYHICSALWQAKHKTTVEQILIWTGWSRQTLYNKWRKHGFKVKDN